MTSSSRATAGLDRARLNEALRPARLVAHAPGEFVGQEDYLSASEITALARQAGAGPGTEVLDLCCGVGGVALHLVDRIGCGVVGLDLEAEAILLARAAARERGLSDRARFAVADVARLPLRTRFDAALLLETLISIEDKPRVLAEVRQHLRPAGRLALTLEEGAPLSEDERRSLPGGDRAWLISEQELLAMLEPRGFRLLLLEDHTSGHAALAERLAEAFRSDRRSIEAAVGRAAWQEAVTSAAWWSEMLGRRRVRKLALVVERSAG